VKGVSDIFDLVFSEFGHGKWCQLEKILFLSIIFSVTNYIQGEMFVKKCITGETIARIGGLSNKKLCKI
jgi:hypothetical protein